ncbi:MAG: hypothetical protein OEZ36_07325, partial [Spirochaetota bacterium]|nr:hypothetical protein [Spirochaetota bacterium]
MTNNSYMLLGPISTKLTFSLAIRNNVSAERGIKGDYVLTITGNSLSYTISYDSRLKSHDITQTGTRFKPYISPERQLNFGNLPQGRYDLTVESDCYLLHHMSIDTTTLTSPLIEALLEPKTQINGTVINGDGDPLSDAIVRVNKD